ncbi:MAG: DUF2510 domain-containing protein [Candidatus Dormibacteraceae bacterium]
MPAPPNWYPDPGHEHGLRYWDGSAWTDAVADEGRLGRAGLPPARGVGAGAASAAGDLPSPPAGGGTLFSETLLQVDRRFVTPTGRLSVLIRDGRGSVLAEATETAAPLAQTVADYAFDVGEWRGHRSLVQQPGGEALFLFDRPQMATSAEVGPYPVLTPRGAPLGEVLNVVRQSREQEIYRLQDAQGGYQGSVWGGPRGLAFADARRREVALMTQRPSSAVTGYQQVDSVIVLHLTRPLRPEPSDYLLLTAGIMTAPYLLNFSLLSVLR